MRSTETNTKYAIILKSIVLLLILSACFCGCAAGRSAAIRLSEEDLKNIEAVRTIAANLNQSYPVYYGCVNGAFGDYVINQKFPPESVQAMKDIYEAIPEGPQKETDYKLGYVFCARARIMSPILKQILEQYSPNLLQYVPALVGF